MRGGRRDEDTGGVVMCNKVMGKAENEGGILFCTQATLTLRKFDFDRAYNLWVLLCKFLCVLRMGFSFCEVEQRELPEISISVK